MALTPEGLEELEELTKLRERRLSAEGIEPTPLTKNEQNLLELIEMRRKFLEIINDPNAQEVKSGLPGDFLLKKKYVKNAIEFLETAATILKLPEIADSLAKGLNTMIEKYNPSSPEETARINKIKNGGVDPNEIKLNGKENLVDQLNAKGVDLELFNEKILNYAVFLDGRAHLTRITLPDGKFLALDINQYNRDKEQRDEPPLGPQKSNQKQPAKSFFAEQNSENQEKRSEEKTPTTIPNYLPTPLPKKGVNFAGGVKKEDGEKGERGQWVSATTQRSDGTNNGQRGGR